MSNSYVITTVIFRDKIDLPSLGLVGRITVGQGLSMSRIQGAIRVDFPEGRVAKDPHFVIPMENVACYRMDKVEAEDVGA